MYDITARQQRLRGITLCFCSFPLLSRNLMEKEKGVIQSVFETFCSELLIQYLGR